MIRIFFNSIRPFKTLIFQSKQPIIASLFKKKNQAEASKAAQQPQKEKEEKQIQKEDEQYNFFQRRKEIDTSFDFSKLKQLKTGFIPEDVGKGGIEQVIYWSQNIQNPQQIRDMVLTFNKVAIQSKESVQKFKSSVHLQQFKAGVIGTVYLLDSIRYLSQYAFFGYKYDLLAQQFWQKLQFKCIKYFPKNSEQFADIIDIVFIMGQLRVGQQMYNYIQKSLTNQSLSIDQYIKLFLIYSNLKIGEKPWIQKLLQGISDNIHDANQEQLTGVLPNIKQAKKLPPSLNDNIEKRALLLVNNLSLSQLFNLTEYLGFQNNNEQLWKRIQARAEQLISGKPLNPKMLEALIHKIMLTYKFSINFIRKYIVNPIQQKYEILQKLSPRSLSSLSKGLYIYQLQLQTKELETEIGKLVIHKITKDINEITDSQLVKVIQDYNLTRNGNRQLYIFFEEVIVMKFVKHYNPGLNRNTIELLIQIYQNSGMCSKKMFDSLKLLLLQ